MKKKVGLGSYLKKYWLQISAYILCEIIGTVAGIFMTILVAQAIEEVTLLEYSSAINTFIIVLGFVFIQRIGYFTSRFIYHKYSNKIMAEINLDLACQAFKLNSKTFADHSTGTFVQRIVNDPSHVINYLVQIVTLITDIIGALVMLIYIATLNIYITLCIISVLIILSITETIRIKKFMKGMKEVRKLGEEVNSITTELVKSEKDIKSLGLEHMLGLESGKRYEQYMQTQYKTQTKNLYGWQFRNAFVLISKFLILILGVHFMDIGMITMAVFMIIYSNTGSMASLTQSFGNLMDSFSQIKIHKDRMFGLFNDEEFEEEFFGDVEVPEVFGDIEFKNVNYSYREYKTTGKERELISTNKVLENLSFKIKKNSTVAFVGRSGSGKSTILNLMTKLYDVDEGQVLIDGKDISTFTKKSLRNAISLVNQFPYIFDMTIRENLALVKEGATEEEMIDALKKASLYDFVDGLHDKIDTKVGESGIKLSGGQKQRLAIARALLRKTPIIIFDESTSSLDNFAQEDIKHSVEALKGSSTVVIVAHRLSTIKNVDKIFFLDQGKIQDVGTFEELFEKNKLFREMFVIENLN